MTAQAMFVSSHGQTIPLQSVAIEARLRDLLAHVDVAQTYANREAQAIEALYTFPLPSAAILLDFEVQLGERRLHGQVVEKRAAEKAYEAAIAEGDLAIMLENPSPGLYTVNLGNLLPNEVATIRFRYALLLDWRDDGVRFALPTTLAPRYGDPAQAGLAPQQAPTVSTDVRYPFSLKVWLEGALADAGVMCPSHAVALRATPGSLLVDLQNAGMDRDVVLDLRLTRAQRGFAWWQPDAAGVAVVAAFQAEFGLVADPTPRNVKIVVDCSGSMAGDSICQAKEGLGRILDGLRPQDEFNVICYGSHHQAWFPRQVAATADNLSAARVKLSAVDANLGGTETAAALQAAYQSGSRDQAGGDVLLITDGEIWEFAAVIQAARDSGHRIFTVGVGSAVSEAFVSGLASATGGACELVSPNEAMAERIHRHFRRMVAPRARSMQIDWGSQPLWQQPQDLAPAFDGDTVVIAAQLPTAPQTLKLRLVLEDQRVVEQTVTALALDQPADDPHRALIPRVAHALRLRSMAAEAAVEAVAYQIPCAHANVLVVDVRADTDTLPDMPALRQVPQELAAGWGGAGAVLRCRVSAMTMPPAIDYCLALPAAPMLKRSSAGAAPPMTAPAMPASEVPMFLRSPAGVPPMAPASAPGLEWAAPPNPPLTAEQRMEGNLAFRAIAERLYRMVRAHSKAVARRFNLEISGSQIEVKAKQIAAISEVLQLLLRALLEKEFASLGTPYPDFELVKIEIDIKAQTDLVIVIRDGQARAPAQYPLDQAPLRHESIFPQTWDAPEMAKWDSAVRALAKVDPAAGATLETDFGEVRLCLPGAWVCRTNFSISNVRAQ